MCSLCTTECTCVLEMYIKEVHMLTIELHIAYAARKCTCAPDKCTFCVQILIQPILAYCLEFIMMQYFSCGSCAPATIIKIDYSKLPLDELDYLLAMQYNIITINKKLRF